jgi:hypothetical protein
MEVLEILELIGFLGLTVVKFLVAPTFLIVEGYSWWYTVVVSAAGAAAGVGVLYPFYLSMFRLVEGKKTRRVSRRKKKFSSFRRAIIRTRQRFGIMGLLVFSGLISVPIATWLAAKYFRKNPLTPWLLIVSFSIWAILLTTISWAMKMGITT